MGSNRSAAIDLANEWLVRQDASGRGTLGLPPPRAGELEGGPTFATEQWPAQWLNSVATQVVTSKTSLATETSRRGAGDDPTHDEGRDCGEATSHNSWERCDNGIWTSRLLWMSRRATVGVRPGTRKPSPRHSASRCLPEGEQTRGQGERADSGSSNRFTLHLDVRAARHVVRCGLACKLFRDGSTETRNTR